MSLFGPGGDTPAPRQLPLEIAPRTFLIRALTASVGGTWTNLNSMVILAAEPIIVDTGIVTGRDIWFEDVFSLVPADEVRWIFVTHNDSDHSGNMIEALERCPNARLVTSHGESFRTVASFGVSLERMEMVNSGESFSVGDRDLLALRPPVYDSPYTRGLFDPVTRVYYASDAFCAPMPEEPVDWAEEMPPAFWEERMARFHHSSLCPWISLVDKVAFGREVDKLAALDVSVLASAHSPAIGRSAVARAFAQMAALPDAVMPDPSPA